MKSKPKLAKNRYYRMLEVIQDPSHYPANPLYRKGNDVSATDAGKVSLYPPTGTSLEKHVWLDSTRGEEHFCTVYLP